MIWKTVFIAVFVVGTLAQDNVVLNQYIQRFKGGIKEACKQNGVEDKSAEVEGKAAGFANCVKSLFNPETIKNEIEEAKPRGALDEVFKKYCDKNPELKTCFRTLIAGVTPCLSADASVYIGYFNGIFDQLLDFVCHKDGDRIALFIAEAGPECFQSQAESIKECGKKMKQSPGDKFVLQEFCSKFDEANACTVEALEQCETPTPSNMAESLFRYIRNSSPCKNH